MNVEPPAGGRVSVLFLLAPCNMDCPYCITENDVELLTWEKAVAALARLRAEGVTNVVLGGGEPLLWKHDAFRLAARAKEMGFTVQLGTNGIRLPDGFERRDEVDRYVLPLDSMRPDVHDFLRPWRTSHHALILDRLERLRAAGKPTTIGTVVTSRNLGDLPAVGDFLRALDPDGAFLHAWHLYRFLPHGRGGEGHANDLAVTKEEYRAACRPVKEAPFPFPVYKRPNMMKAKSVDFHWVERGDFRALIRRDAVRT